MSFKIRFPSALQGIPAKISSLFKKIENHRLFAGVPKKIIRLVLAVILLAAVGSAVYFPVTTMTAKNTVTETATLQTASVTTGDLIIYATGSGTLTPADQVDLAFGTGGVVKAIYFQVNDMVNEGELLAEVDDSDVQIKYKQAKRNLLELTSMASIASAEEAIAAAQSALDSANNHLAYVISPDVFLWEREVKEATQAVDDAKAALEASPDNADLKAALEKAEAYLDFAEDKLDGNWYYYEHKYLPNNFTVWDRETGTKYVAGPSDTEIMEARAAVTVAEAALQEAKWYYAALTGGDVPEDATGSNLTQLESQKLDFQAAEETLNGTKIYAPFSGKIMAIDTSVGDTSGTGTVITLADLSQYYLEIYLDETDWSNVAVGYKTEIIFDALPDETFTGEVTQVDPGLYTSGNTSVVKAIVKLNASTDEINLPIGSGASVDVIAGEATNAMLVPVEAIHKAGDQYAVFVMENGEPRLHVVEIGIQDLLYVEVKSGLNPGDVVTTGIVETR